MDPEKTTEVALTESEKKLLGTIIAEYRDDLRARKNPPKGMSYGQIEDALNDSKSLLEKLGVWF